MGAQAAFLGDGVLALTQDAHAASGGRVHEAHSPLPAAADGGRVGRARARRASAGRASAGRMLGARVRIAMGASRG